MSRIEWTMVVDEDRSKRSSFKKGDTIYHGKLLLGWVDKIEKPLFEEHTVTMTLASREARDFVFKELDLDDPDILQLIPTPFWLKTWRKIKRLSGVYTKG